MDTIPILLTEEEAKRFVLYQKYHSLVVSLQDLGIDQVKNGSMTIHFDSNGKVRCIEKKEQFTYF